MSRTLNISDGFDDKFAVKAQHGFDSTTLRNKTVVITGGGSGIGEASLRAFVKAGAFVAFSDLSRERGEKLVAEIGDKVIFVPGDVTVWADQLKLFKVAIESSPSRAVDIVFANAGTASAESAIQDSTEENGDPKEPDMLITKVNLIAVMYTVKLARHYWKLQPFGEDRDRCLIMTASIAGYWDHASAPQYAATKWGVRGLMRSLRSQSPEEHMRVNIIAPWFIRTNLVPGTSWDALEDRTQVEFAQVEDAATAVVHLASDKSINGRALAVVPRSAAKEGYVDFVRDSSDVEQLAKPWHGTSKQEENGQ